MWERLRRFSVLERRARGIFLRAAALLPPISLRLRLRGFRKTQSFLQRFLSAANNEADVSASDRTDLTARMVRAAVRHSVCHPTCLEESLALTCTPMRLAATMFGDGIRRSWRTKGNPNEFSASRFFWARNSPLKG
jgi:hypothetical protein